MAENYNGWSNYETWNVKLWIDNDGSLEYWEEQAVELLSQDPANAVYRLSKALESSYEENAPELSGCYADILGCAMQRVNWREIAEAIVSNVS